MIRKTPKRLFDASAGRTLETGEQARLLAQLVDRLEQHDVLYHVLASYEIRPMPRTIVLRCTCSSSGKRWSQRMR